VDWRAPSVLAVLLGLIATPVFSQEELRAYAVVGDAIPASLSGKPGDAARGRAIVANRTVGLCLLCHSGPIPEERFQGTLAPSLAGAGARWSEGQLRLRLVDAARLNPDTIIPAYYPQPSGSVLISDITSVYMPGSLLQPSPVSLSAGSPAVQSMGPKAKARTNCEQGAAASFDAHCTVR